MTVSEKNVGLVGLGLIGSALARRLLDAGYMVSGYDIDAARRARLTDIGGRAVDSVAGVTRDTRRIVVAVFSTDQVEAVVEGTGGILEAAVAAPGPRMVLNVTTSDPERIAALAGRIVARDVTLLEVPLSGTSEQVARGDGVGLIGGNGAAYAAAADILDAICPRRFHVGAIGNGGKAKLAVNLVLGLNRAALAEGIVFAQSLGLDARAFLEIARGSAAYSQIMDIKGDKMVDGDFAAHGKVRQSLKDVDLMLEYAARAGQTLPLTQVAQTLLAGCVDHGEADWDNCAVMQQIRRLRS